MSTAPTSSSPSSSGHSIIRDVYGAAGESNGKVGGLVAVGSAARLSPSSFVRSRSFLRRRVEGKAGQVSWPRAPESLDKPRDIRTSRGGRRRIPTQLPGRYLSRGAALVSVIGMVGVWGLLAVRLHCTCVARRRGRKGRRTRTKRSCRIYVQFLDLAQMLCELEDDRRRGRGW
jgi:hypothetical protein